MRPRTPLRRRTLQRVAVALFALGLPLALGACGKSSTAPGALPPRSYRMGFAASAPRLDFALLLQSLGMMTAHSDAAIMSNEAPWDSLLAGTPPDAFVRRQQLPLADYYRGKGLRVWVYLDPANGLNRAGESNPLVAAGRSITEPAIQQLYKDYAVALDTLVRPDVFGCVLETNLIRAVAPAPLYAAIRQVANDAAAAIRAHDAAVTLAASVQVETAWGKLTNTAYQGIDTDFADFPFIQQLGLSSYPYFVWTTPDTLPADYYSRLLIGHTVPVAVVEGGWTSENFSTVVSTPEKQRLYLERQAQLLDGVNAKAWFQLTFTDIELHSLPASQAAGLLPFSRLGVLDTVLAAKPALSAWDAVLARPLQ
jgi:hypothetical protein